MPKATPSNALTPSRHSAVVAIAPADLRSLQREVKLQADIGVNILQDKELKDLQKKLEGNEAYMQHLEYALRCSICLNPFSNSKMYVGIFLSLQRVPHCVAV
ncbi:hypothetical protein MPER_11922 [Moniliophthora perniciosa FA553]|nr:hypothetical protein MPER_11922 [Moniliophthora perniciosa FA553]